MPNSDFYIGGNDEHGVNPPTPGKRTPVVPGLNREIYENEFNRAAKDKFLQACIRQSFSVFDVKPEQQDIPISQRIVRINRENLTALVTFAYNAYGEEFNDVSGVEVFFSPTNPKASQSRLLAQKIYDRILQGTAQNGRGVKTLDVGVLSSVNCASALVEAGFMTNLVEARRMINPLFQTEVGEEACQGVCDFLGVNFVPRGNLANYPLLRRGADNSFVFLLQFILNTEYGANLAVDGIFGQNTENAVREFQQNNSLSVDGIVGQNTWKTLLTLMPYPTLRQGDRGAYVRLMQSLLESALVPVGGIDGIFGAKTDSAVREFQEKNSLAVDGIVGPNTWNALTE